MFDHLGFAVRDLNKTRAFYTAALEPLGCRLRFEQDGVIAFGPPAKWALWFYARPGAPSGVHIAPKAATPTCYGGFVIDPGHNLEAVCYASET